MTSGTASWWEDRLVDYIIQHYDLQKALAEKRIEIDICSEFRDMFESSRWHSRDHITKAVQRAVLQSVQKEKYKEIKDVFALNQAIVKDNINKLTQIPFIDVTIKSIEIPVQPLHTFIKENIDKVVQFNALILAVDVRKGIQIADEIFHYQDIILQELEEETLNNNPVRIKGVLHEKDTYTVHGIGTRKKIIGLYKAVDDKEKNYKKFVIDCYFVEDLEEKISVCLSDVEIEETKKIILEDEEEYMKSLVASFCPHIKGRNLEKTALLLSAVGGVKREEGEREESHLMLVGEPGTAKSELLKFANSILPKSSIIDGSNSTSKGIVFGLDEFEGRKTLHAGAMIQNSGGHIIIDEYDKMPVSEQKALNMAMEQQKAYYDKAGHNAEAPTKTCVIVAANPVADHWNPDKNIVDNFTFEGSTLNRFDIIIRLKHILQEAEVSRVLKSITGQSVDDVQILTKNYLASLINYARTLRPTFSDQANEKLIQYYEKILKLDQPDGALAITYRQFHALRRLCLAYAKLTFREVVDEKVVETITQFCTATQESLGMNTGGYTQLDLIGNSTNREQFFEATFRTLMNENNRVNITELSRELKKQPKFFKTSESVTSYVSSKKKQGWLYEPELGEFERQ